MMIPTPRGVVKQRRISKSCPAPGCVHRPGTVYNPGVNRGKSRKVEKSKDRKVERLLPSAFCLQSSVFCLLSLTLLGCGPSVRLTLQQPQVGGYQQQIVLTSERAAWSPRGKVDRVLVEFPLPGATTGRPTYLLYLRLPAQTPAVTFTAKNDSAKAKVGQGFFIQTRGDLAGLAVIAAGQVFVKGRATGPSATRQLQIELTCEDGSRLTGKILARRDDWYLKQFETERRPVDVQGITDN